MNSAYRTTEISLTFQKSRSVKSKIEATSVTVSDSYVLATTYKSTDSILSHCKTVLERTHEQSTAPRNRADFAIRLLPRGNLAGGKTTLLMRAGNHTQRPIFRPALIVFRPPSAI